MLLMDGWYPKVRIGKRRVRVPVLVTLGVRADGERVVVDVRLAGDESTAAWRDVIRSLVERQVGRPLLAIIDGSAGLAASLREQWPTLAIQRCTAHKVRNLEAKAPVRLREELAEDYPAASLAAVTGWVRVPTMGDVPFAHLACPPTRRGDRSREKRG
jgi:transposase-like protein